MAALATVHFRLVNLNPASILGNCSSAHLTVTAINTVTVATQGLPWGANCDGSVAALRGGEQQHRLALFFGACTTALAHVLLRDRSQQRVI